MGATIKTWELTFVDLSEDKVGDFSHIDPYDDNADQVSQKAIQEFWDSPIGEAQRNSLVEEMKAQMAAQGVEDYEPSEKALVDALRSGQTSQKYGGSPDVTNEKMLEDHGPEWYQDIGGALAGLFSDAKEAVLGAADDGVNMAVDGVTQNDGLTGQASESIGLRQMQIEKAIEESVNGGASNLPGVRL